MSQWFHFISVQINKRLGDTTFKKTPCSAHTLFSTLKSPQEIQARVRESHILPLLSYMRSRSPQRRKSVSYCATNQLHKQTKKKIEFCFEKLGSAIKKRVFQEALILVETTYFGAEAKFSGKMSGSHSSVWSTEVRISLVLSPETQHHPKRAVIAQTSAAWENQALQW